MHILYTHSVWWSFWSIWSDWQFIEVFFFFNQYICSLELHFSNLPKRVWIWKSFSKKKKKNPLVCTVYAIQNVKKCTFWSCQFHVQFEPVQLWRMIFIFLVHFTLLFYHCSLEQSAAFWLQNAWLVDIYLWYIFYYIIILLYYIFFHLYIFCFLHLWTE